MAVVGEVWGALVTTVLGPGAWDHHHGLSHAALFHGDYDWMADCVNCKRGGTFLLKERGARFYGSCFAFWLGEHEHKRALCNAHNFDATGTSAASPCPTAAAVPGAARSPYCSRSARLG